MALFSRKDKTAEIIKAVSEEIQKSLAGTPMANSGYANSTAANPYSGMGGQGLIQVQGESTPMRRWGQDFGSMLGPAAPLLPAPIDPVLDDSGRPIPRKYEYQIAVNLNLTQSEVPFQVLKSLTEQCDIIHRCIEIRISEIVKQRWSFSLSDDAIATIMEEQNVSHAKASKIGREKYGEDILRLTQFWDNPYVHNDRGWVEWITEALWQHFAFDQVCVYPRYNFKKKIIGFDVIDAPTIKILLDNRGDIPYPPAPAYQQILWGFPRGEFTASPEADGEFYTGPGRGDQFLTDQLSVFVKNRRTWSPYGFSAVEECIPAATLYLERQTWMRDEYQAGSTPKTWMETNSQELDHLKLAAFERVLNDKLTGSSQERHRVKVLPEGFHPVEMKSIAADYKSDYDEFIIKRIGSAFGVSPSQLGVIARAGMGGGKGAQEGESDNAETVSKKPMENFIVEMVNSLCRRYLGSDRNITFILNDQESGKDEQTKAAGYQTSLYSGQLTMNDIRGEIGMPLYDMPEADEPMIVAGSTIQFLKGMLEQTSAGETVGQKENPLDETSAQPEGLAEEETQPPVPEVQAETLEESKSAEARAYKRFVSKPRARDFVFQFHTPDEAETLKAQITDTPKGRSLTKRQMTDLPGHNEQNLVTAHYAPLVRKAIADGVSGLKEAVAQAVAGHSQGSKASAKVIAKQSVQHNIRFDASPLQAVLKGIYADNGLIALKPATTSKAAGLSSDLEALAGGIDWSNWKPGNPEAAAKVAGGGLKSLLDNSNATIKGITDTTMARLGDLIAAGIDQGLPSSDIADSLDAIVNDPARAEMIAQTEGSRAYNASSLDSMVDAGLPGFEWLAYDGACEECADMEGNHDFGDEYPPLHPNCRCAIVGQSTVSADEIANEE